MNETQMKIQEQINKAPDYVTTWNGVIIYKLLSNMADHFNKSFYWRKSQYAFYERRFRRIPANFLKEAFLDFLSFKMGKFVPPVKEVYEYVASRPDFDSRWLGMEIGSKYCIHCRTSEDGLSGGVRTVFYYGHIKSLGRVGERSFAAKCNCEAGLRRSGPVFTELVENLEKAGGKEAEVTFSYFDEELGRLMTAKEQTNYVWRRRVALGHYKRNEDGHIVPNFAHPIYRTSLGRAMCRMYDFELPKELEPEVTAENMAKDAAFPKAIGDAIDGVVNENWRL